MSPLLQAAVSWSGNPKMNEMMKSYQQYVLLGAVMLFSACSGNLNDISASSSAEDVPDPVPVVRYDSEFTVQADEATKLYFDASDGYALKWSDNDRILISNGPAWQSYYVKEGGDTHADLLTEAPDLSGSHFYAVFPYPGNINPYTTSDNLYHLVIPTSQSYTEGGFAPSAFPMVGACGAVKALQFKNAGAVLAIKPVSGLSSSKITSITVSANEPLAGACTVTWDGGAGEPSVVSAESTSVTLNCGNSGIDWGTTAHICIAPGTYTDFCVEVVYTNSTGRAHYTWRSNLTVSRSKIKKLTVDFTDVVEYKDLTTIHPVERTALATPQTANCYLISDNSGGKYRFPVTVKVNGVETTYCTAKNYSSKTSPADIKELYVYFQNGAGSCATTMFSEDPEWRGDYVCFELKAVAAPSEIPANPWGTATADNAGTALIAISSNPNWTSGEGMNAIWSWMVWYNPAAMDFQLGTKTTYKWLNINLGGRTTAYSQSGMSMGYYYQWGRKDPIQPGNGVIASPFVVKSSYNSSFAECVANPHVQYGGSSGYHDWSAGDDSYQLYYDWWNANQTTGGTTGLAVAKTMFDPCPAGYHVMSYESVTDTVNGLYSIAAANRSCSGTSLAFYGWGINFPSAGRRCPGIDVFGKQAYTWTTVGNYVNSNAAAVSFHTYSTDDSTSADYKKREVMSFSRTQAHTIRCEKE